MTLRALPRGFTVLGSSSGARGNETVVEISADSPFFEGHFPGRPILPAVAQLLLLGSGELPIELPHVRFLEPVEPGARLAVLVRPRDERGLSSFEIRCGDVLVTRGRARFEPGRP